MSGSRQLATRNAMVDWQVAPAEWQMANYDEPKIRYRREVEEFLKPLQVKSLRKKTFVTISTNVLCAEIASSKDTIDPIERDIYLPLEIALTKWSFSDSNRANKERQLETKCWLIDPGPPIVGSIKYAKDQKKFHKIDYGNIAARDLSHGGNIAEVAKEINSMLTPDRVVFSVQLKHCRQDLGCLKWINREIGFKIKPIKVYSLEDLFVVLSRRILVHEESKTHMCQGVARHNLENKTDTYAPEKQCDYHQKEAESTSDAYTRYCSKAMAECYSNVLLDVVKRYADIDAWADSLPDAGLPTNSNDG